MPRNKPREETVDWAAVRAAKKKKTRENNPTDAQVVGETRVKQSFKDELDFRAIAQRYIQSGEELPERPHMYGDFSESVSFQDSQYRVAAAKSDFMELPARIRTRFENDVGNLLDFMADPANEAEAAELGLIPPTQEDLPPQTGPSGGDQGPGEEGEPSPPETPTT